MTEPTSENPNIPETPAEGDGRTMGDIVQGVPVKKGRIRSMAEGLGRLLPGGGRKGTSEAQPETPAPQEVKYRQYSDAMNALEEAIVHAARVREDEGDERGALQAILSKNIEEIVAELGDSEVKAQYAKVEAARQALDKQHSLRENEARSRANRDNTMLRSYIQARFGMSAENTTRESTPDSELGDLGNARVERMGEEVPTEATAKVDITKDMSLRKRAKSIAAQKKKYKEDLRVKREEIGRLKPDTPELAEARAEHQALFDEYSQFLFEHEGFDAANAARKEEQRIIAGKINWKKVGSVAGYGALGTIAVTGGVAALATLGAGMAVGHGVGKLYGKVNKDIGSTFAEQEKGARDGKVSWREFEKNNPELLKDRARSIRNRKIARLLTTYGISAGTMIGVGTNFGQEAGEKVRELIQSGAPKEAIAELIARVNPELAAWIQNIPSLTPEIAEKLANGTGHYLQFMQFLRTEVFTSDVVGRLAEQARQTGTSIGQTIADGWNSLPSISDVRNAIPNIELPDLSNIFGGEGAPGAKAPEVTQAPKAPEAPVVASAPAPAVETAPQAPEVVAPEVPATPEPATPTAEVPSTPETIEPAPAPSTPVAPVIEAAPQAPEAPVATAPEVQPVAPAPAAPVVEAAPAPAEPVAPAIEAPVPTPVQPAPTLAAAIESARVQGGDGIEKVLRSLMANINANTGVTVDSYAQGSVLDRFVEASKAGRYGEAIKFAQEFKMFDASGITPPGGVADGRLDSAIMQRGEFVRLSPNGAIELVRPNGTTVVLADATGAQAWMERLQDTGARGVVAQAGTPPVAPEAPIAGRISQLSPTLEDVTVPETVVTKELNEYYLDPTHRPFVPVDIAPDGSVVGPLEVPVPESSPVFDGEEEIPVFGQEANVDVPADALSMEASLDGARVEASPFADAFDYDGGGDGGYDGVDSSAESAGGVESGIAQETAVDVAPQEISAVSLTETPVEMASENEIATANDAETSAEVDTAPVVDAQNEYLAKVHNQMDWLFGDGRMGSGAQGIEAMLAAHNNLTIGEVLYGTGEGLPIHERAQLESLQMFFLDNPGLLENVRSQGASVHSILSSKGLLAE